MAFDFRGWVFGLGLGLRGMLGAGERDRERHTGSVSDELRLKVTRYCRKLGTSYVCEFERRRPHVCITGGTKGRRGRRVLSARFVASWGGWDI